MKKRIKAWCFIVMVCWLLLIVSGCTSLEHGETRYNGIGRKEFDSLKVTTTDADGTVTVLEIKKYGSESAAGIASAVAAAVMEVMLKYQP